MSALIFFLLFHCTDIAFTLIRSRNHFLQKQGFNSTCEKGVDQRKKKELTREKKGVDQREKKELTMEKKGSCSRINNGREIVWLRVCSKFSRTLSVESVIYRSVISTFCYFETRQTSVWFQLNQKMVNIILFRYDLIRFRKDFSVCRTNTSAVFCN